MTENPTLTMQREELINELRNVDNIDVIRKVQHALNRALEALKKKTSPKAEAEDEEVEYISKEELEQMYLHAFTEMYRAKKEGWKLKSAEELLNEL